jgi:transposase
MYKRLYKGAFNWPRTASEAVEITEEQYRMLMKGLSVIAKNPITQLDNPPKAM